MAGMVRRFMSSFGFTSSFAIAVSLIVSFTLTPMLAARMIKRKHAGAAKVPSNETSAAPESERRSSLAEFKDKYVQAQSKESRFYRPIDRTYTWMLKWSMHHRWAIVMLSVLVILSTVPLFMFVGKNFLPVDDQAQFELNLRVPEGTTLVATRTLSQQ